MNIKREEAGELTASLKIEIKEEDYQQAVKRVLKDYQKKANMPGFRPGKVPYGMIQKMYGKAVIADEVNKILSDGINDYIQKEEINILGHPIANTEKTKTIDFEHEKDFEFFFDIGLAPELDFTLDDTFKVDYYKIKADNKTLEKYLEDLRKRYGDSTQTEESVENDILRGNIQQLDADGKPMEDGVNNDTTIYIDFIKDKNARKDFLGRKKADKIIFNPMKATDNVTEASSMLGVKKEETDKIDNDYQFTIEEIHHIEPAKLNKEFYQKVFPQDEINNKEEFMDRLQKDIEKTYEAESDRFFMNTAMEKLVDKLDPALPEDFLKKWLLDHNQGKVTREEIDKDFDNYAKSLKYQLIQNKIIKDFNIEVKEEEIRKFIKDYFINQMGGQFQGEGADEQLDGIVDSMLQNKDEVHKINDQIFDQKIRKVVKENVKLNEKKISYDDFVKLVEKTQKQ